jgi:hypothetical protein
LTIFFFARGFAPRTAKTPYPGYIRWFDQERLRDSLRISIGTAVENDILLSALDRLLRQDFLGIPATSSEPLPELVNGSGISHRAAARAAWP